MSGHRGQGAAATHAPALVGFPGYCCAHWLTDRRALPSSLSLSLFLSFCLPVSRYHIARTACNLLPTTYFVVQLLQTAWPACCVKEVSNVM